jgi:hypothetical protein
VSEKKELRETFEPKKYDINEQLSILKNEEICDLFSHVTFIVRTKLQWTGQMTRIGEMRNASRISVGKTLVNPSL